MKKSKTVLLGGCLLALLMTGTFSQAQNYQDSDYKRGGYQDDDYDTTTYTVNTKTGKVSRSSRQSDSYPYQSRAGYYSQNYRPGRLPVPPAKAKSPVDLLEESINKVIRFLSRPQQASLEQITFFLKKEITPNFDFQYMARWVAGRHYRNMSPEQRREFSKNFAELFITTFVQKLTRYKNYPPVVEGFVSRRTSDDEALATAAVINEHGGKIQVDFKFIKTPKGWKVVDVRANGVSALFYYRNFFAEQIRKQKQNQAVFN